MERVRSMPVANCNNCQIVGLFEASVASFFVTVVLISITSTDAAFSAGVWHMVPL